MSAPRKPSGAASPASNQLAQLIEGLPHQRRSVFLSWLEREDAKAKKPKRGPGRPRHMDEPMTDSVTVKLPPSMRAEIRAVASALGCRNEAEYLRRLHIALLKVEPSLATRRPKAKGSDA